ncbi:MAG: exonuclease SbcC [Saprospiraceae bacterium]|jgi:exonuclease SbcC
MLPISLKLQGIYSYQEMQTIDFRKLTEGHLFGIFGEVGSGKSTILEAISLALFDKTERFGSSGGRNYNMMNLKSNNLFVEFEFQAENETYYKFKVTATRNSKNFDDVKTYQRDAYKKEGEEWTPIDKSSAPDILGLSYQNFHRTVIIPQGKFSEFLQLTDGKRSEMMQEIFQLQKYDLSYKSGALLARQKEHLFFTEGNLKGYEEVSKQVITEIQKNLKAVDKSKKETEKELKKQQQELKKAEQLKVIFEEAIRAEKHFKALSENEGKHIDLKQQVKKIRFCQFNFASEIKERISLENELQRQEKDKEDKQRRAETISENLTIDKKEYEQVKVKQDKKSEREDTTEDLSRLLQIRELEETIAICHDRLKDGKIKSEALENHFQDLQKKLSAVLEKIKTTRENLPDSTELTNLKIWFAKQNNCQESVVKSRQETEKAKEEFESIAVKFKENLETAGCQISAGKMPEATAELSGEKQKIEAEIDVVQKKLVKLEVHSKLESFAAELADGEKCPVCGAIEHPELLSSEGNRKKIAEVNAELKILRSQKKKIEDCTKIAEILIEREKDRRKVWLTKQGERTEAEKYIVKNLKEFPGVNFSLKQEKEVNVALKDLEKTKKELEKLDKEAEDFVVEIKKEEAKKQKFTETFAGIKEKIANQEGTKDTLTRQLKFLKIKDYAATEKPEIISEISRIEKDINKVEKRFLELQKKIDAAEKEHISLLSALTEIEKNHQGILHKSTKVKADIQQKIAKSDFADEAAVQVILEINLDLEKVENKIDKFFNELNQAKSEFEKLKIKTEDKTFDKNGFENVRKTVEGSEKAFNLINEEFGKLTKMKLDAETKLKKKEVLEEQKEVAEIRLNNIKKIHNLFTGKGFVDFISSAYLKNLCISANERFKPLTNQQLELVLDKKNHFLVLDYLNGGKTRSARTLSGGQTFQASLSLALALAESVQKQNQTKQNFFFLDEGFGTQDKQSLQAVFEALKSLRKENRMVGVISHVEELQQEINVSLMIEKDEQRGSLVRGSWE